MPFTLIMFCILLSLGIYGQTHVGPLEASIHQDVAYSPKLLLDGQVHRLITSVFFTAGGWMFYVSLAMFLVAVGWTEWFYGTRRTLTVFWGVHLITLLAVSLLISLPLATLGSMHGNLLYHFRDVGPSAGYYGCLGFAIGNWQRVRLPLGMAVLMILLGRLAWSGSQLPDAAQHFAADSAHVLAIIAGLIWASLSPARSLPLDRKDLRVWLTGRW